MNAQLTNAIFDRPVSSPVRPARRAQRTLRTFEEELFDRTKDLRRFAVYNKARWVPDAANEVDVSVWAAIRSGEHDLNRLRDVARVAASRQRKWHERQRRNDRAVIDPTNPAVWGQTPDVAPGVVVRFDMQRAVSKFPVSEGAREWAARAVGLETGGKLPGRVKMAGYRWSSRVREALEVSDAA